MNDSVFLTWFVRFIPFFKYSSTCITCEKRFTSVELLSRVPGIFFLHTFRIPRRDQALEGDFEWSPFQLKDSDLVAIAANEGGKYYVDDNDKDILAGDFGK